MVGLRGLPPSCLRSAASTERRCYYTLLASQPGTAVQTGNTGKSDRVEKTRLLSLRVLLKKPTHPIVVCGTSQSHTYRPSSQIIDCTTSRSLRHSPEISQTNPSSQTDNMAAQQWRGVIENAITTHQPQIASINKYIHENPGGFSPETCALPERALLTLGLSQNSHMKSTKPTIPSFLFSNLWATLSPRMHMEFRQPFQPNMAPGAVSSSSTPR